MSDVDKVIQHFQDAIEASGKNNKWRFVRLDIIEDTIALLKKQPEIVRCGECLNADPEVLSGKVWCPIIGRLVSVDGYCCEGEKAVNQNGNCTT